jgi:hypothetical protein
LPTNANFSPWEIPREMSLKSHLSWNDFEIDSAER